MDLYFYGVLNFYLLIFGLVLQDRASLCKGALAVLELALKTRGFHFVY